MSGRNYFFDALGITNPTKKHLDEISKKTSISSDKLKYYNDYNILPDLTDLVNIENSLVISRFTIMIKMEIYNSDLTKHLRENANELSSLLKNTNRETPKISLLAPSFKTEIGQLFNGDCLTVMKEMQKESVDLIFADPPFNLNKFYLSEINDNLSHQEYLNWSQKWIDECIRILKPNGTFYLWNIPKWNSYLSDYLNRRLTFKHWIATDIKFSLPINGRLYPSHYSLLMYTKGIKPKSFHPDRLPMEICKNCYKELKDYGGYKDKMNPKGINLSDVWYDIPPVRHKKYKAREEANELSTKLLDRIIEMSSEPYDTVFDPFGGSGTTFIVAEIKKRNWIGCEIGPIGSIIERFNKMREESGNLMTIRERYNNLFPLQIKKERKRRGLWTDDTFMNSSDQVSLFTDRVYGGVQQEEKINQ